MKKTDTMKMRGSLIIPAVFLLAMLTIQPALSADTLSTVIGQSGTNNTTMTVTGDLDLRNDTASQLYNSGDTLVAKGDYENAIALFDQALASNTTILKKTDALLYLYRDKGYAQIQLGNYTGAIATLDAGIGLYPKDAMLWNNRGLALEKLGKTQDALAAYDKAVSFDRNYTRAHVNRGILLTQMGRYSEAVEAFSRANETEPFNEDILDWLDTARKGESESTGMLPVLFAVAIIAAAAGIIVWYVKFRKPAEPGPEAKKAKSRKK
jgi:tetratricopeptide (TPR) repeat protein